MLASDPRDPPARPAPGRRIVAATLALALAYAAAPWVTALGLARAIRDGDAAGVARRIDPPGIRRSLARQLVASRLGERPALGPLERSLVRSAGVRALEAWLRDIAPDDVLAEIVAGRRTSLVAEGRALDLGALSEGTRAFGDLWQVWLGSGFEGPFAYTVSARRAAPLAPDLGMDLGSSGWIVRRLVLPAPLIDRLAAEWLERAERAG